MKKTFLILCMAFVFAGGAWAQSKQSLPRLRFQQEIQPFDTLVEGTDKAYTFAFTNTGSVPLLLEAFTACGCTVANVPKDPVLPGQKGSVLITYNTQGRRGPFEQTILLRSAAAGEPLAQQDEYLLKIRGLVLPAAAR